MQLSRAKWFIGDQEIHCDTYAVSWSDQAFERGRDWSAIVVAVSDQDASLCLALQPEYSCERFRFDRAMSARMLASVNNPPPDCKAVCLGVDDCFSLQWLMCSLDAQRKQQKEQKAGAGAVAVAVASGDARKPFPLQLRSPATAEVDADYRAFLARVAEVRSQMQTPRGAGPLDGLLAKVLLQLRLFEFARRALELLLERRAQATVVFLPESAAALLLHYLQPGLDFALGARARTARVGGRTETWLPTVPNPN